MIGAPDGENVAQTKDAASASRDDVRQDLRELGDVLGNVAALVSRVTAAIAEDDSATRPLLRVEKVAEWVGISPRAVLRQINLGNIPATKVSGRWVVLRDEWLAKLRAEAARQLPPIARGA